MDVTPKTTHLKRSVLIVRQTRRPPSNRSKPSGRWESNSTDISSNSITHTITPTGGSGSMRRLVSTVLRRVRGLRLAGWKCDFDRCDWESNGKHQDRVMKHLLRLADIVAGIRRTHGPAKKITYAGLPRSVSLKSDSFAEAAIKFQYEDMVYGSSRSPVCCVMTVSFQHLLP